MKKIIILLSLLFAASICRAGLKTDAIYFTVDGTTQTSAAFGAGGGTGSSGPAAYGSLYTKNGAVNQTNISFTTATLTFFANAGISTHAVSNATTDSVTVATSGIFNVYAVFVSSDNSGSSNLHYSICVNGVPSNFSGSFNPINYHIPATITGILSLNVGDVVTLCGFANESPGVGLSIVDSQFIVSSAGGIGGTTIISGGSSTSPLGVFKNGVQISSPTSQINFSGNYWDITLGGTSTGTVKLIGGNTNYIQVSNTLQSGATAYPQYLSVGSTNAIQETPLNVSAYHNGVSYAPILNILNTGNGGFSASSGGVGFSLKNSSLNDAVLSGIYDSGGSLTAGSETGNLNLLVKNSGAFPTWPQIIIDPNKTTITNRLQGYSDLQLNTIGLFYSVGATEKVIWYHNSGNGTWTYNGDTFTLDKKINFLTGVQASSATVIGSNGVGVTYGVTAGSVTVNNLTASQFVKTDANKRLSSQAQISLASEVTGTLSASNFVSTAAYTVSTQTFSGQNTFSNTANSFSGDGSGLLKISSLTATGVTAGSYTNTNLTVDAQGRITAASNGSAGSGGGSSSLGVFQNGTQISSPTAQINFIGPPFSVSLGGSSTATVTLNGSSVTLQGNTFNAANRLLQLSASNLVPNSLLDASSATLQGNTFNVANKLLQLSGSGLITNSLIDGSSITKQGLLIAGSNITLTPSAGALTIAASASSGVSVYPATSTVILSYGLSSSTGVFTSSVTAYSLAVQTGTASNPSIMFPDGSGGVRYGFYKDVPLKAIKIVSDGIGIADFYYTSIGLNYPTTITDSSGIPLYLQSSANNTYSRYSNTAKTKYGFTGLITPDGEDSSLAFGSSVSGVTMSSEAARIDVEPTSARFGNVGINISTPTAKLHVGGTMIVESTFTVSQSTIVLNGTTYYWNAGTGSSGQFLKTDGAARPTLTWGSASAGGGTSSSSFTYTFNAAQANLPGANAPYISNSTNAASAGVFFDESSTQTVTWATILNGYKGGTLYSDVVFTSSATTGTMNWGTYIECKTTNVDALDYDTDSFSTINSTSVTVGATSGMAMKATVALTNQDSCADGDTVRIKLERTAGTNDTAVGKGRVRFLRLYE